MSNLVVSLAVYGVNPQRISLIVIDPDKPAFVGRQPIRCSAFGNYLEEAIVIAKRYAAQRGIDFDPEWALLNYCYLTPAHIGAAAARVDQRLLAEARQAAQQAPTR
ncbi:hypothetical protein BH10CHL1_BH10CHL1_50110 [soil metagenome]